MDYELLASVAIHTGCLGVLQQLSDHCATFSWMITIASVPIELLRKSE
jgi:hypothetical protein